MRPLLVVPKGPVLNWTERIAYPVMRAFFMELQYSGVINKLSFSRLDDFLRISLEKKSKSSVSLTLISVSYSKVLCGRFQGSPRTFKFFNLLSSFMTKLTSPYINKYIRVLQVNFSSEKMA